MENDSLGGSTRRELCTWILVKHLIIRELIPKEKQIAGLGWQLGTKAPPFQLLRERPFATSLEFVLT